MTIDPELSIKNAEIEEQDRLAKQKLDNERKPIEERINLESREQIEDLLKNLKSDYSVDEINNFVNGKYQLLIKNKPTGEVKLYEFEVPLEVVLPPLNPADPENVSKRTNELHDYLSSIINKK